MKILLAVDDSEYSVAATEEVTRRPWPNGTTVRVLSVVEPVLPMAAEPLYGGHEGFEGLDRELQKRGREITRKTAEDIRSKGVKTQRIVRTGDPATEIVNEAEECGADLIIMGSHGYTGIKRLLLGSVAVSVVSHAPCSVEIVRAKQGQEKQNKRKKATYDYQSAA
jgi:nucleotide-binding universal stress UspA family protein